MVVVVGLNASPDLALLLLLIGEILAIKSAIGACCRLDATLVTDEVSKVLARGGARGSALLVLEVVYEVVYRSLLLSVVSALMVSVWLLLYILLVLRLLCVLIVLFALLLVLLLVVLVECLKLEGTTEGTAILAVERSEVMLKKEKIKDSNMKLIQ